MFNSKLLVILISFLIVIIGIGYFAKINYIEKLQNPDIYIESFNTNNENIIPNTTFASKVSMSATSPNVTGNILLADINFQDDTIKNISMNSINNLLEILNRYKILDVPIIINDNGKMCNTWGKYNPDIPENDNRCQIINNKGIPQCLDDNRVLSSCNLLYQDGTINKKTNIDINPLIQDIKTQISSQLPTINANIINKSNEIDIYINQLIMQRNMEIQQQHMINNIENYLNDKELQMNKNRKDIGNKETKINQQQIYFNDYVNKNRKYEYWSNIYFKIIIGLFVLIVLLTIFNILFSNIL